MTILDKIVAEKRREVAGLAPRAAQFKRQAVARQERRDFAGALRHADGVALIAEIKKASPSAGVICADFDPDRVARQYTAAGAQALSVLTDETFFQGRLESLRQVRVTVPLPVLRKDFIIDELQIHESVAAGADAILLIVAILDDAQLRGYRQLAADLRVAALVEVHDERELDRALAADASLIGINNRDLRTFRVDLRTTETLAGRVGAGRTVVAESGIHTRADVARVAQAGAQAILVGESLMRSGDVAGKVAELLGR